MSSTESRYQSKKDLDKIKKKEQSRREEQLRAMLGELGGGLAGDDTIVFYGDKLIIPESMTLPQAYRFIKQTEEAQEKKTAFTRTFKYRPLDGAYCTLNALKRVFGAVLQKEIMTFFGPEPPQMRTINSDVDETCEVPWGRMVIPLLPGADIVLGAVKDPELGPLFQIYVEAPKKYANQIQGLFKLIEAELKDNSLYRGKAINGAEEPAFIDLRHVDPSKVIYSDDLMRQLTANIWVWLRHSAQMKRQKNSLKRAVLLYGNYGTGKSLGLELTAKEAVDNGWTYLLCRPGADDINEVMKTARLYEPSVVAFEDIDTVADPSRAGRDQVSILLDTFDGITSKGSDVLVLLTTNHVENIHKGMIRPGRLDAVIEIGLLDQRGIERLVKSRVKSEMLGSKIDYTAVYEAMKEFVPAFAVEAIQRAVTYGVVREEGDFSKVIISTQDLVDAAAGLQPQLALMNDAREQSADKSIDRRFQELVAGAGAQVVQTHLSERVLVPAPEASKALEKALSKRS